MDLSVICSRQYYEIEWDESCEKPFLFFLENKPKNEINLYEQPCKHILQAINRNHLECIKHSLQTHTINFKCIQREIVLSEMSFEEKDSIFLDDCYEHIEKSNFTLLFYSLLCIMERRCYKLFASSIKPIEKEIIFYLLSRNADVNKVSTFTKSYDDYNINQWTPLHYAVAFGFSFDIVQKLVECGANVNEISGNGFSSVMLLFISSNKYYNSSKVKPLDEQPFFQILQLLLQKGANLNYEFQFKKMTDFIEENELKEVVIKYINDYQVKTNKNN